MAPTTPPLRKYHVFLSFRGDDVRSGFISHLYDALDRSKIDTFIDYRLNQGEDISPALLKKIEESMISVIIFSKRYADSKWCLDELMKIFYCRNMFGQVVLPVFFDVDPNHVAYLTGPFGDGFAQLYDQTTKHKWLRYASTLKKATNISGFVSENYRDECVLKEEIIRRVLNILEPTSSISSDNDKLVGRDSSIKEIESLLQIESNKDYCILGFWGMGGIGKTALAKDVYKKFQHQFEDPFFFDEVRDASKDKRQNESPKRKYLGSRRVFIVLDDVTTVEQIEDLVGDFVNCFGQGSRLIITTRDKCVLQSYEVLSKKIHILKVEGLLDTEALQLFSRSAFGKNHPCSDYDLSLSKRIVEYANGVPLALVELGQYLRGFKKKVWKSAINKLQKFAYIKNIQEKLRLSYDGLDHDNQRSIFLDIAFFFKGEHIDLVKFLIGKGSEQDIEISVLINKCLISISQNKIIINNLLQAMSREIVREESPAHPENRSRLCWHDEILEILKAETGTREIKGLCLDFSKILRVIKLSGDPFGVMTKLEFFKLHCGGEHGDIKKVKDFQGIKSARLRYLCWYGYPCQPLQTNFQTKNLVVLDIPHSGIEVLGMHILHYYNLKHINLSHSKRLAKITDLSKAPNLKNLILEGCISLSEISPSIELPKKLARLNLRDCKKLTSLPNIMKLKSLEDLHLFGCLKLDQNALKQKIEDFLQMIKHRKAKSNQALYICFPGAKIPEWFTIQRQQSSIALNIPDGWSNNRKVVSFALCAIVENGNYQYEDDGLKVGYDFKHGTTVIYSGTLTRWDYGKEPCYVEQDHVFLCFEFHVTVLVPRCNEITIQFFVKDVNGKPINTCGLKSCGFHLLHYQDVGNPLEGAVNPEEENRESQPSRRKYETPSGEDPVEDPLDGAVNMEEKNEAPNHNGRISEISSQANPVESPSEVAVNMQEVNEELQNSGKAYEALSCANLAENPLDQGAVNDKEDENVEPQQNLRISEIPWLAILFDENALEDAVVTEEATEEPQDNGRIPETSSPVTPASIRPQEASSTGTGRRLRRALQCLLPNCISQRNAND